MTVHPPTPRQIEILAAWWFTKGSSVKAAKLLGLSQQTVRNQLYQFRLQEKADSNLDLALQHVDDIDRIRKSFVGRKAA